MLLSVSEGDCTFFRCRLHSLLYGRIQTVRDSLCDSDNTAGARAASTESHTQRPQRFTLTLIDAFLRLYIYSSQFSKAGYELLGLRGTRGSKAHAGAGGRHVRPLRSRRMPRACDGLRRRAYPSKWHRGAFEANA